MNMLNIANLVCEIDSTQLSQVAALNIKLHLYSLAI